MSDLIELQDWQEEIHNWAKSKGWWKNPNRNIYELVALVHSELSEAVEAARIGRMNTQVVDGKPEGFYSELADAVIRICDIFEAHGQDLHTEMRTKMAYNATRPHRHGGKLA